MRTLNDVLIESGPVLEHPNDRFVTIMRKKTFLEKQQPGGQSFFEEAKMAIGSYFASKTSPVVGTGLTTTEQNLLLPEILDIPANDREFRKAVTNWYVEFYTPIPYKNGLRLNIGLQKSNDEPVSAENMPINLVDYLRYRHAIGHPQVRSTEEQASGDPNAMYYIHDAVVNTNRVGVTIDAQDKAMGHYLEVKNDSYKVNALLTLLGIDPVRLVLGKPGNKVTHRLAALKEVVSQRPSDFLKAWGEDNFNERYIMLSLTNANIWSRVGGEDGAIMDTNNNEVIGQNTREVLAWMANPANNNKLTLYKNKLREYLKDTLEAQQASQDTAAAKSKGKAQTA